MGNIEKSPILNRAIKPDKLNRMRVELSGILRHLGDMEIANFFISYINDPPESVISPSGEELDMVAFYIEEAKDYLPRMENENAKKLLKDEISKHESTKTF